MSGIAGAVSSSEQSADTEYFRRWACSLEKLATEGIVNVHCAQRACLAHAPLSVYGADQLLRQPVTLNGETWIAADARLDALEELRRELRGHGRDVPPAASDAEMILHAYAVWGSDCVEHVIGDFGFVLWDEVRGRLLAATDHFGVRPLYYASTGEGLVVSNWGAALHAHRSVDRSPDDAALVDFLRHGQTEPETTAFTGIRVLPRASRLVYERGQLSIDRYWTLPVEEPLLYADEREYVEHFLELLKVAVTDRIRDVPAAVLMSGGLDSTAIAVAAKSAGASGRLTAHTAVYDSLIPDDERGFAAAVAEHLGIPISFHPADDYVPFSRLDELALTNPVPTNAPFIASLDDQMRAAASQAPVVLTGHGTDAILAPESLGHLMHSTLPGQFRALLRHAPRHFRAYRRRPTLGILPTLARLRPGGSPEAEPTPPWLRGGFPEREPGAVEQRTFHPFRSDAYRITTGEWVPRAVAQFTPMAHRAQVSCAHPFIDLRLVRFCLRLPPVPLCWDKHLLRIAMRGQLPPDVVVRPKTPIRTDVLGAAVRNRQPDWLPVKGPGPVTSRYYAWPDFVKLEQLMATDPGWVHSRPVALELFSRSWSRRATIL